MFSKKFYSLALIALVVLSLQFAGCANKLGPAFVEYSGPDAGTVVVGLTADAKAHNADFEIRIRRIGEKIYKPLGYYQENMFAGKPEIKNDGENGNIVSISLPAGKYEIFSIIKINYAGYFREQEIANGVSIGFTVEPRSISYLGHYQAKWFGKPGFMGNSLAQHFGVEVSDNLAADLKLFKVRSPAQENFQDVNFTPKSKNNGANITFEGK